MAGIFKYAKVKSDERLNLSTTNFTRVVILNVQIST